MRLLLWVHLAGGTSVAAKELGVSRATLYQWLGGRKEPTFLQKAEIYRATLGAVNPEDISELRHRDKRFRPGAHCPCCGLELRKQEFDDMRRRDHGLLAVGGGKKWAGRKKVK
jgi:DNA-binding transcriptional regulator YdaS (Cro superfamily)